MHAPNPLQVALFALLLSAICNLSAIYVFQHGTCEHVQSVDDSHFSYVEDDHPHQLPLHVPTVALTFEDSERYGLSNFKAWEDWRSLDMFPYSNGFVRLGPEGRGFGVSMFHQLHCLQIIRDVVMGASAEHHTRHCFNILRQAVLCASDTTLDLKNTAHGANGLGMVHVCRDWRKVYEFVENNQLRWPQESEKNMTKGHDI